ncbi:MAG: PD-(D/E)XK nuclease family protein [Candidatus Saccharimonadales bacterium]
MASRSRAYDVGQTEPYRVSRSKIELFMQCPRCFWLDARLRILRPSSPPFTINKAIDELFKREFDVYREKGKPHPIMTQFSIDAVPMQHDKLNTWRQNFTGVSALHEPTNLWVFGAIDDLWQDSNGQAIVVDYKATAKEQGVSIDAAWQISYKRQLEVYQWLLRQNGLSVSDTGYFVYTNAVVSADGFYDKVDFVTKLIPYIGNDSWVEPTLISMKKCIDSDDMPPVGTAAMGGVCEFCQYARARTELTLLALEPVAAKPHSKSNSKVKAK